MRTGLPDSVTRKQCLMFYLLLDLHNTSGGNTGSADRPLLVADYARRFGLPPSYQELCFGFWLLDTGVYAAKACQHLCNPAIEVDWAAKIMRTLCDAREDRGALTFSRVAQPAFESLPRDWVVRVRLLTRLGLVTEALSLVRSSVPAGDALVLWHLFRGALDAVAAGALPLQALLTLALDEKTERPLYEAFLRNADESLADEALMLHLFATGRVPEALEWVAERRPLIEASQQAADLRSVIQSCYDRVLTDAERRQHSKHVAQVTGAADMDMGAENAFVPATADDAAPEPLSAARFLTTKRRRPAPSTPGARGATPKRPQSARRAMRASELLTTDGAGAVATPQRRLVFGSKRAGEPSPFTPSQRRRRPQVAAEVMSDDAEEESPQRPLFLSALSPAPPSAGRRRRPAPSTAPAKAPRSRGRPVEMEVDADEAVPEFSLPATESEPMAVDEADAAPAPRRSSRRRTPVVKDPDFVLDPKIAAVDDKVESLDASLLDDGGQEAGEKPEPQASRPRAAAKRKTPKAKAKAKAKGSAKKSEKKKEAAPAAGLASPPKRYNLRQR